jgi:hypothetical protein
MEPKKVGRALGIGVRVASKMVQQRVAQGSAPQPVQVEVDTPRPDPGLAGNAGRPGVRGSSGWPSPRIANAKRGAKAFGQAFLGPFTPAGSVLWLEITGLFFALFALFFGQGVYRVRTDWRPGADHAHLLLYLLLTAVFGWFSGSSFLRAYGKNKQGPRGQAPP